MMDEPPHAPTPERVNHELAQAENELAAAHSLLENSHLNIAISSGYFACFHAARAVLYQRGVMPVTHKGVRAELNRVMVKEGGLEKAWAEILEEQHNERELADYHSYSRSITAAEATRLVNDAQRFVQRMKELIDEERKHSAA